MYSNYSYILPWKITVAAENMTKVNINLSTKIEKFEVRALVI
jgi:hypothetical protein